jgi:hypothetical protein
MASLGSGAWPKTTEFLLELKGYIALIDNELDWSSRKWFFWRFNWFLCSLNTRHLAIPPFLLDELIIPCSRIEWLQKTWIWRIFVSLLIRTPFFFNYLPSPITFLQHQPNIRIASLLYHTTLPKRFVEISGKTMCTILFLSHHWHHP